MTSASSSFNSNINTVSQVRVGVRVRPLTSSEDSKGGKIVVSANPLDQTVGVGSNSRRQFTFDSVFDSSVTQFDLYQEISSPLLNAFLDGYNATVMAYGQTGSGKTFTMGSESLNHDAESNKENQGLIPRFISDIFGAVLHQHENTKIQEGDLGEVTCGAQSKKKTIEFELSASFLEVYGEEIHDLLDEDHKSLPIREDSSGEISVVGLKCISISNLEDALNVLQQGTLQRTTAATLMNHSSSRSHAVFTIHLQKVENSGDSSASPITSCSRLTFVDLAGSERMKRTGAEGERAREGIKINEGLLALGNVINALADEERLAKGEKIHVPYRQSKLTRLLQDALGGNSQTLFLACISPADTNANETLSTLQYANRARNIKNKPVKNVDPISIELKRLHALTNILQSELLKEKFGLQLKSENSLDGLHSHQSNEQLFARVDVQEYIAKLYEKAKEDEESSSPIFKQMLTNLQKEQKEASLNHGPFIPDKNCISNIHFEEISSQRLKKSEDIVQNPATEEIETEFLDIDPDQDIAILDQLLELQRHDQEYDQNQKRDQEELNRVDGELLEQEELLHQLRENLKQYHNMKQKYEVLMSEVQNLEAEKKALADELENVQVDPTKGCSKAIKIKLEKVEKNLSRARAETRKHQNMYRKAEMEAQKCRVLERKISELKLGKVSFLKKQRENAAKHRDYMDQKRREIQALKKKERKNDLQVSKLQGECKKHKMILEKRKKYCFKLSEKLKRTESHLMQVLDMRKRESQNRPKNKKSRNLFDNKSDFEESANAKELTQKISFAERSKEIDSMKFLLEKMIDDKVENCILKMKYEENVSSYSDLMRLLVVEVKALNDAKDQKKFKENKNDNGCTYEKIIQDHEENIEELELKIDLISSELEDLRLKFTQFNDNDDADDEVLDEKSEKTAIKVVSNLSAPVTRTLLWDMLDKLRVCKLESINLRESVERKDSALQSCESEIEALNEKVQYITKDFDHRRSLSRLSMSANLITGEKFDTIKNLKKNMNVMKQKLEDSVFEKNEAKNREVEVKKELQLSLTELAETREKLALFEAAAGTHSPSEEAQSMVKRLQNIWEKIGVDLKDREAASEEIRKCLEKTCAKKLEEASQMRELVESELICLQTEAKTISEALDSTANVAKIEEIEAQNMTLLQKVRALEMNLKEVEPSYLAACDRRQKIVSDTNLLMKSVGKTSEDLSNDLQLLLSVQPSSLKRKRPKSERSRDIQKESREKRAKIFKDVENMVNALEPKDGCFNEASIGKATTVSDFSVTQAQINTTEFKNLNAPPHFLSSSFLDKCEIEVKKIRLKKSEIVVSYGQVRDTAHNLSKSMNLSPKEVLSIVVHSVKKGTKEFPTWWDAKTAESVCSAVIHKSVHVKANQSFGEHLHAIKNALDNVASGRSALADKLKELVGDAHQSLLRTVEGTIDSGDATALFNAALIRLPPLSKDYIQAYIDEINVLTKASKGMSQSELEALMLVWKVSDISQGQRGEFWSEVDVAMKEIETTATSPFDSILKSFHSDLEEWILLALQSAIKAYRQLHVHLFKLRKIHEEVEKQRAKQDTKSRITSLDAEIRIISAQLAEFEERANSKGRLLTKKLNSTNFLKEERFRKHMQAKFGSKLESLGLLLHEWKRREGSHFNPNLLSEDVQALLQNSEAEGLLSWVEQRTAFMHLKMVKSKALKKHDVCSLPTPPRTGLKGTLTYSPSIGRKQKAKINRSVTSPLQEKKKYQLHSYNRPRTPSQIDRKGVQRDGSSRSKTSTHGQKLKREGSLRSATPPNPKIQSRTSKIITKEGARNSSSVAMNISRQTTSVTNKDSALSKQKSRFNRHMSYLESPSRKHFPQKNRDKKRNSILPFGDILANTPKSKENKTPI